MLESPRAGVKLSVKLPEPRRPSMPGQSHQQGHSHGYGHSLPYQGSLGHHQQQVLAALGHDDGYVVTSPGSLVSYPSHASTFGVDWNAVNSPPTARTNMLSMASGGHWGSLQLTSSSSFSGWSSHSGASSFSRASSFRRGVAPQVSVELIEWRSLQLGRRIGRGAEGCVFEARHQDAPVAIKEAPSANEIEMYLAAGVHDNLVGLRALCHKALAAGLAAPEVLDEQLQQPHATVERILKADVYSLGVTIWQMVERRRPFEGMDGMQICALWIADPGQMVLPALTVAESACERDRRVLSALQDLVRDCTAFNPDDRPSMKQVLERIRQIQRLFDPRAAAAAAAGTVSSPSPKIGWSSSVSTLLSR
ncbi:hypothetical protein OEZ85_001833 [Tetradesmus obliquus]|uniref:Protein kinase domain-containing protein n=1 Tax=Tetradesmus obliquus TaxID=3088 RepID=A0ABY8U123_TETOB|nr:hypothetical protein OEZ85_001833 [Tetradesmus obliquus]